MKEWGVLGRTCLGKRSAVKVEAEVHVGVLVLCSTSIRVQHPPAGHIVCHPASFVWLNCGRTTKTSSSVLSTCYDYANNCRPYIPKSSDDDTYVLANTHLLIRGPVMILSRKHRSGLLNDMTNK